MKKGARFRPRQGLNDPLPESKSRPAVHATCPRCEYTFTTRNRYCVAICRCGYLLKIEPAWNAVSADDVMEVATPDNGGGPESQKIDGEKLREGIFKVLENWHRRGLVKTKRGDTDGHWGVQLPSHEDGLIEKEQLRDAGIPEIHI